MMSGAAIVFFAFIGFDAVSTTAEETKNPQRDMPIGIIASLIICTVLYVLMAAVITGMRTYTTYFGDSAAVATAFAGRPWAQALISAGALAGLTSVLLVFQLGQPRIFMAMARDGLLPRYFARIHRRFCTPDITTIWTGIAVGGVAMLTDIGSLADLTNIGTLFAFILVCLGVIILRRKDASRHRPFRVPMVPLFPLLGVFFCFVLMLSLPLETWGACCVACHRVVHLFPLWPGSQQTSSRIGRWHNRRRTAAADQDVDRETLSHGSVSRTFQNAP